MLTSERENECREENCDELDFSKGIFHDYDEEKGDVELSEDVYSPSDGELLDEELESEENEKRARKGRKSGRRQNVEFYVDPDRMNELIREYYKTDNMTDELALDIKKICDKLMTSFRFANYTYRDEMAEDAFYKAYVAIYKKKFDVDKGYSPFSYITQIAFHAAQARIKIEKKERMKVDDYRDRFYDDIKEDNTGFDVQEDENDYRYGDN